MQTTVAVYNATYEVKATQTTLWFSARCEPSYSLPAIKEEQPFSGWAALNSNYAFKLFQSTFLPSQDLKISDTLAELIINSDFVLCNLFRQIKMSLTVMSQFLEGLSVQPKKGER